MPRATMRLTLVLLLLPLLAAFLAAQRALPREQDEDQRSLSYALPAVEEVHLASFADFERFVAQGAWSRAFRAIGSQLEDMPRGFLAPDENGFAFSWREGLWRALVALPPAGRRAFRLFHDAKARRDLARAASLEGAARRAALEVVFYSRFLTSSGDDAASGLAADAEAAGDWHRAAFLLEALLEHHPDSDLDDFEIRCRLARSLAEIGEKRRLETVLADLGARHAGRSVDIAPQAPDLEAWSAALRARSAGSEAGALTVTPASRIAALETEGPLHAPEIWKVKLKDMEAKGRRNAWQPSVAPGVPDHVLDGDRLLVNHAGEIRLLDIATGTEVWKAGRTPASLKAGHPGRCFVRRHEDRVLVTGPPTTFAGAGETVRLLCRDAATGESLWNTRRIEGLREVSFLSPPLVREGLVHLVAKRAGINAISLVALRLEDGTSAWELPLGTPVDARQNGMIWFGGSGEGLTRLRPRIVQIGSEFVVLTDGGAVLGVDPAGRRLTWAYTHPIRPGAEPSCASVLVTDGVLLFTTLGQKRLFRLDVARRRVQQRPICVGGAIVGADEGQVYVFGDELQAYRRDDLRRFRWAAFLKRGEYRRRPLLTSRALLVHTKLGLVEIDRDTGDSRRVIRAGLPRLDDVSLVEHGGTLIAITPQAIFAFRLAAGEASESPSPGSEAPPGPAKKAEAPPEERMPEEAAPPGSPPTPGAASRAEKEKPASPPKKGPDVPQETDR